MNDLEEEFYRQSKFRGKRGLAEEIAKYSLCFAMSEHDKAVEHKRSSRALTGTDVVAIKAGILGESIHPGDEVEGEALACAFTAIYQPRAYYPSYFLGEMRAALRRGESPPSASAHYLPVSVMPPLPDGWGITFLYPLDREGFDRSDFPSHARDVLTRDYMRLPMLVPPGEASPSGKLRFRARILRLSEDTLARLSGMGEKSYEAYSARGLTFFLKPMELEVTEGASMRGSLFAEISLMEEAGWDRVVGFLEEAIKGTVEEVFPQCTRGERQGIECYLPHSGFHAVRFRRRLFAMVYDPVIVIYRAPRLLGIYLPCDLMGDVEVSANMFERYIRLFAANMQGELDLSSPPVVDIAYDNRLSWAKEGGALRGHAFSEVGEEHPLLRPTLEWMRGD
jgi:hypothetical protein